MNKKLSLIFGMFLLVFTLFPLISSAQDASILTLEPVEINSRFVTLKGEILDLGSYEELNVSFEYKAEGEENWTQTEPQLRDITEIYQKGISELEPNTYYRYRFIVENEDYKEEGSTRNFTTDVKDSLLFVDYEKDTNVTILIIVLILAGLLFVLGHPEFTAIIFLITGFSLMVSGVNIIISVIIILIGILSAFMKGGNN
ncbi:MAG: hypothetical protein ACOC56_05505 [Atribacterota bacterium]